MKKISLKNLKPLNSKNKESIKNTLVNFKKRLMELSKERELLISKLERIKKKKS